MLTHGGVILECSKLVIIKLAGEALEAVRVVYMVGFSLEGADATLD